MNQSSGRRTANIKIRARHSANAEFVRPRPEFGNSFEVFVSNDGFSAYIKRDVLAFIKQHAKLNGKNETIGLLCGRICRDPNNGPYTLVMAAGDAREGEFKSTPGDVKLLASGHTKLSRRITNVHPDREIVGWYHTHPSYPPRFSGVDLSEQSTWTNPNHIGIVYSGNDITEPFGVYRGPRAILLEPVADTVKTEDLAARRIESRIAPFAAPPPSKAGEPANTPRPWLGYRRLLIAALVILAGISLLQSSAFLWLNRRVSTLERGLRDQASVRPVTETFSERPSRTVPSIDKPTSHAVSASPEPVESVNRLIDPELHEPAKPMLPQNRTPRPAPTPRVAGSAAAPARREREKKTRAAKGGEKPKPTRKKFSSPGEQIVPPPTITATPKP